MLRMVHGQDILHFVNRTIHNYKHATLWHQHQSLCDYLSNDTIINLAIWFRALLIQLWPLGWIYRTTSYWSNTLRKVPTEFFVHACVPGAGLKRKTFNGMCPQFTKYMRWPRTSYTRCQSSAPECHIHLIIPWEHDWNSFSLISLQI